MIICFSPDSYVSTSSHNFTESFGLISGTGIYRIFLTASCNYFDIPMSNAQDKSYFYLTIPPCMPHVFSPSTAVLASETGFSTFSSLNTFDFSSSSFSSYTPIQQPSFAVRPIFREIQSDVDNQSLYICAVGELMALSLSNLSHHLSTCSSSLFLFPCTDPLVLDAVLVLPASTSFSLPSWLTAGSVLLISGSPSNFFCNGLTASVDINCASIFPTASLLMRYPIMNTSSTEPLIIKFLFELPIPSNFTLSYCSLDFILFRCYSLCLLPFQYFLHTTCSCL